MPNQNFTPINWTTGQLIDEESLDQINANETWLRDNMVDGKYIHEPGWITDTGIKLLCGRIYIPPQNVDVTYGTVGFPQMFTPNCLPVIATSLLSPGQNKQKHVVYGIGTHHPDHRGFNFKINVEAGQAKNAVFSNPMHLMWIAMGW